MKNGDVKLVFKKDDKTDEKNYRGISIFPGFGKVYERLIYNQICPHFDKLFSKLQGDF